MKFIQKTKSVITKFLVIALVVLLQNSMFSLTVDAKQTDYLDVVDTVKGLNSYYNLNGNLNLAKTKLVLVAPSKKITVLDEVKKLGSIKSNLLAETGKYTLALGYKVSDKYAVLDKKTFVVNKNSLSSTSTANLNSILESNSFGFGGDTVKLMSEDDRFKFVNAPSEVATFSNFSMTVQALNASGAVDVNYRGTIVFESDDENAELPQEYTFLPGDAGVKSFNNAFTLVDLGEKTISVKDKNSALLLGSVKLDVVAESSGANEDGALQVDSPTPGTVTNNQITFVGSADAGLEIQLLDSGVFLDQVNAGPDGKFVLTTDPLPDGDYIFSLKTSNAVSDPIAIKIVSSATKVASVSLSPVAPVAGSNVELTVTFESQVDVASAIINGVRVALQSIDASKTVFRGTFKAPLEVNEYPINIDVTNKLGVKVVLENVSKFNVLLGSADAGVDGITFNVPSQVLGVQAVSADRKVTLSWNEASALNGISFYRVYYGTDPANLSLSVDTNDSGTSWFIPELENGVKYYFQVYGVDAESNEGDQPSAMISVVPGVDGSTTLYGSGDGQVLVGSTAESGPEVYAVIIFSLLVSGIYFKVKKEV